MKPGSDMSCGAASSLTATSLLWDRLSRILRRVRSASAANTLSSSSSAYLTMWFSLRPKKIGCQPPRQWRAFPGVRGKGITSLTLESPVTYAMVRSKPRPKPAWGALP